MPERWRIQQQLGLGFVLTEDDPYTCVDLDGCVGKHGQIDVRTREILDLLSGWVELSPSGTGLHVWVRNDEPVSRRTKRARGLFVWPLDVGDRPQQSSSTAAYPRAD